MKACQLHRLVGCRFGMLPRFCCLGLGDRALAAGRGFACLEASHRDDDEMCEGSNVEKGSAGLPVCSGRCGGACKRPRAASGASGRTGRNPFNLRV